jgi:sulfite reductase (NADPH) hemoprotein beta-component
MDDKTPRRDLSAPLSQLNSNEQLKYDSRFLRGSLKESFADPVTGAVSESDALLTKFFGVYQQDDRDLRDERRRARLEPRYQFMVRVRMPGGVCTPTQWLALDALARKYAGGTLRLTTRQTVQFHGVRKRHLRALMQGLRDAGLDTIAACGDDNRNVICTANPMQSGAHETVSTLARAVSARLMPRTGAYREVFLGQAPAASIPENEEPVYGRTYLPRKFKIAIAIPPQNDVDVYAHDLGFVAILEGARIVGYDVLIGGGMGMTHRTPATFPRLSDAIGFCTPDEVGEVAEHTMCIQRDFGDRKDRAHARFKYTIEDRGVEWFLAELARRRGKPLQPKRRFTFVSSGDRPGWIQSSNGRWHYTLIVENGRLSDFPNRSILTGLRSIATSHGGLFALTTNQNITIAGIETADKAGVERLLRDYGIENSHQLSPVRQSAMACVALPTCALAMAESERYMPDFMSKLESLMEEVGVGGAAINVRMSGCPNGCSRPYLGEIALVGKSPGKYNLYLGASASGDRLNALYRESVDEAALFAALRTLLSRYGKERDAGESFGDFVVRIGAVSAMLHGRDFNTVAKDVA